jgi:hypothetical protein
MAAGCNGLAFLRASGMVAGLTPDFSSLHLDAAGLLASLFWGGIGMGVFVYGKKQRSAPALFGGIALLGISYFLADSAVWMCLAGAGILAGMYYWSRHGDG